MRSKRKHKYEEVRRSRPKANGLQTPFFKSAGHVSQFMRPDDERTLDDLISVDRLMLDGRMSGGYNLITCLPSSGGILAANRVHPVMLDHLGLDRMHDVPRPSNQSEEDAFCTRMKGIGAEYFDNQDDLEFASSNRRWIAPDTWWPPDKEGLGVGSYEDFMKSHTAEDIHLVMKGPEPIVHCWPEAGGVWVKPSHDFGEMSVNQGLMRNARTMEELCQAIKESRGWFYEDPKDCELTQHLV